MGGGKEESMPLHAIATAMARTSLKIAVKRRTGMKPIDRQALSREEARIALVAMSTILSHDYSVRTIASFLIRPGKEDGILPSQPI